MRALWSKLEAFDQLKHVFFVLCDSHGLQLLLGDILKLPWFTEVLEGCSVDCQIFPRCPQRADNTVKVPTVFGHRRSLILNVPTRWGTTVGLMNSVLKNEEAIMRYARLLEIGNSTVTPVVSNLRNDPALVDGYLPFAHFFLPP
jgi:hypothetical protein